MKCFFHPHSGIASYSRRLFVEMLPLKSQPLVSTQLLWVSSKALSGNKQPRVPQASMLLATPTPITGPRCSLEQAPIGDGCFWVLCFVPSLGYHLFQLFNTAPSPRFSLWHLRGVSAWVCTTTRLALSSTPAPCAALGGDTGPRHGWQGAAMCCRRC